MKKILIGLLTFASLSSFADELCGQTWVSQGRAFIDGKYLATDTEVLIPAHAKKIVALHFKNDIPGACLVGKLVKVGTKEVFVAVDVKP